MVPLFIKEMVDQTVSILRKLDEDSEVLSRSVSLSEKAASLANVDKRIYTRYRDTHQKYSDEIPSYQVDVKISDRIIKDYENIEYYLKRQNSNYKVYIRDIYEALQMLINHRKNDDI